MQIAAIDERLQKFWELEDCSETEGFTAEERVCEEFFKNTVTQDSTGR